MTQDIDKLVARARNELGTYERVGRQTASELLITVIALTMRLEEAEAVIRPFADGWSIATHHEDLVRHLSLGQLGELAAHEVSGAHFHNAARWLEGK